jgi:hypothetical protein
MPQPRFDRSQLHVLPLAERIHDMPLSYVMSLDAPIQPAPQPHLPTVARGHPDGTESAPRHFHHGGTCR